VNSEGSILLAGCYLKVAVCGLVSHLLIASGSASLSAVPLLVLGVMVGLLSLSACVSTFVDIKRFVAASSVIHLGYGVVLLASGSEQAAISALITLLCHSLTAAGSF